MLLTLTGSIQWQFEAGHDLWATPVSNGGHLYLSSMDHNLYGLDKMNGEPVWQIDVGGAIAGSPALGPDGILYVGTFGNQLIALDSADGREVWRADSENWVWSGPTLDGETLYFGDLSGTLYSLNTADGSQRWQVQPDSSDERAISDSPLVVEDTVYFVTDGGALWAIDKETGNTRLV